MHTDNLYVTLQAYSSFARHMVIIIKSCNLHDERKAMVPYLKKIILKNFKRFFTVLL